MKSSSCLIPDREYRSSGSVLPRAAPPPPRLLPRRSVAAAVRCYRPRGRLTLFESEPYRGGNATLLEGHRRHATVAIERLEKAHRPRAEPTGAVEYKSKLWGPLSHSYQPDCTLAD